MLPAANLLGEATSPYLIQHAGNPVHWRTWSPEALAEAKERDRPILLSIGYAACHWCHVMAHESFEDPETAALMNQLFVNVKVDREERPDVDHIYMTALHAMGEQGGWPLTMFLTPDGAPIYGGTYWPPTSRWGRPSFRQVLRAVDAAWRDQRDALQTQGASLVAHLDRLAAAKAGGDLAPDDLTEVSNALLRLVDPVHGGIGDAPKFPNAPIFRFFWQESFRRTDPRLRASVRSLLGALSAGGIYDHLGGGFARYSTDARWHVPHFEKMLYDNAQILELLALAYAETPNPLYAARVRETFDWLMREMLVDGAFAASLDADSEGEEGRFYVWSADEIALILGKDAAAFNAAYDVRPEGNWEGHNVLQRIAPPGDEVSEARLAASRAKLFAAREKRIRPNSRRQDSRGLERPHHRSARTRRSRFQRTGIPKGGARRLRLCRHPNDRSQRTPYSRLAAPGAAALLACSTTTPRWRAPLSVSSRRAATRRTCTRRRAGRRQRSISSAHPTAGST